MRILIVTESYWPNADGGALFERRLAHGIAGLGHQVTIWAPGTSYHSTLESDPPTTILREKSTLLWANPKYRVSYWPWWSARRVINQTKPDVIHIHNAGLMGLAALFWAKRRSIPVIATNHFMPENALLNLKFLDRPWTRQLIWNYLVWFHNRCNFVTSPTPTAVKLLVDHGLTTPHKAISNGIDTAVFHPGIDATKVIKKYSLADKGPILLYFGRVDGEKRIDLIISALPLIIKQQKAHLVIAGAGVSMAALTKQAHELGVSEHVTFTGAVDSNDKPAVYNAATAFVMASPAELQSIVMLEAMATELPIISVDVAALKELCHDGENGFLFPENDYEKLAQSAIKLLSQAALRKKFGKASLDIVNRHHSTTVTFTEYESVYRGLLEKTT